MGFGKISNKQFIEFNKTFSLMLLSKLSIVQALDILIQKTKHEEFKEILKKCLKDVKSGLSLSNCFAKHPQLFSEIYLANVRVGEETGQLDLVMSEYTVYIERIENLKRKVVQALRYPALVLFVSFLVVAFMVFFLIPTFQTLFISSKIELPFITKVIISFSVFIKDHLIVIILLLIAIVLLIANFRKIPFLNSSFEKFMVHAPFISNIYLKNLVARFSLSLSFLLSSKVTLLDALKISRNVSGNHSFRSEIDQIIKKISRGESFSAIIKNSLFFDVTFSQLLIAGEESAQMEKVFSLISNYYQKDFDYYLDNITSLLEPVLILFIGIIVAVILVAMYLPIFEIANNFGV